MSARLAHTLSGVVFLFLLGGCAHSSAVDVAFEVSAKPTLDASMFQRVFVAGFVVGGTDDIDVNEETVRLLRSQLRSKTSLKVVEGTEVLRLTDMVSLTDMVVMQRPEDGSDRSTGQWKRRDRPKRLESEEDLGGYEQVFANTAYWQRIGEEYLDPLIVTGTVLFTVKTGAVLKRDGREERDSVDRHQVLPRGPGVPAFTTSCALRSNFIFIDGRTGAIVYSEVFREAVSHDAEQGIPALSSYFELMDRILPSFLGTVSTQKFRTYRLLLK